MYSLLLDIFGNSLQTKKIWSIEKQDLCLYIAWQGISITRWIRHVLWCSLWEEHTLGNRISIWVHKRSSVCRQHYESSCMSILGPFSIHYFVDSWLFVHYKCWIKGRPSYSGEAGLLNLDCKEAFDWMMFFMGLALHGG